MTLKRKNRKFTPNERIIFRLGVSVGEDRVNDLEKVIKTLQTANNALVEVLNNADARDAKRPSIPG